MSAAAGHDASDHAPHGAGHTHGGEQVHGTRRGYLVGFSLSVLLTAAPFGLVMAQPVLSPALAGVAVVAFAVVQVVVHMVFFLHMNGRSEGGWTATAMIFTLIVVAITMSGTLWVMYHLNTNMMPLHQMDGPPPDEPL